MNNNITTAKYQPLIKRLRDWPKICGQYDGSVDQLHDEAADAIEELAKESERWQAEAKDWYLAYMGLLPTCEESEEE